MFGHYLSTTFKLSAGILLLEGDYSNFPDLANQAKPGESLKLNLGKLKILNSLGIKSVFEFVQKMGPRPFEYHECPISFIDAIAMFPGVLGAKYEVKRVKSFFVPYECSYCETSNQALIRLEQIHVSEDGSIKPPTVPCPKCKNEMAIDVDPEDYFYFIVAEPEH